VRALEGLGYRETRLHLIAERLGKHESELRHQEKGGAILTPDP
jgi:hypothetical protein